MLDGNHRIVTDPSVPRTDMKPVRPMRGRFTQPRVSALMLDIFGEELFAQMRAAGVDRRMMFGTNPHYQALALGEELRAADGTLLVPAMPPSKAVAALILPRLGETLSLEGSKDPSNQMRYTPGGDTLHGKLLHKYDEIVLGYASPVCSAHCRYCYRLDLFNKDTGKLSVRPEEMRDYVLDYNGRLEETGGLDPQTGARRYPIREMLLSGGDPMVLTNAMLYRFLYAAGQSKISTIRIGSKEWAFRPERFDDALVETLRIVHRQFPGLHINMVAHFSHPDEILLRDAQGRYVREPGGAGYVWMQTSRRAVERLTALPFVTIENQTPIISHVNDDADALRLLHEEIRRFGVKPKYLFQCRDIEGYKAFSVPLEQAWEIHNDAMRGLSDTARSRFAMATEWGKMEIVSLTEPLAASGLHNVADPSARGLQRLLGEGLAVFKLYRSPHAAESQGALIVARRNPQALWISDYEDRVLYDGRQAGGARHDGLLSALLPEFAGAF